MSFRGPFEKWQEISRRFSWPPLIWIHNVWQCCKCIQFARLCVRICVHVYHVLFLQRKLNYVSSSTNFFLLVWWNCFSLLFSKEHVEDGERREWGVIWFSITPCFSMLETKSALRNHKTQARCVVSSPTATPLSYPPIRRREKEEKKECRD